MIQIALPVFNGADHLAQALDSLLNQTYENFVLTIVDNASSDATEDISRAYEQRDHRIRYVRFAKWVGWVENWARAYDLVAGRSDFFMWASDDDLWDRGYIEWLLPPLLDKEDVVLSFSQYDDIDQEGKVIDELYRDIYPRGRTTYGRINSLIRSGMYSAIYGLMKTRAIYWNPCLRDICFAPDLWFLLCMATAGRFHIVKKPLLSKRLGGISVTDDDPSIIRDISRSWNIGKKEWDLINGLRVGYRTKLYLYYRLRLQAKSRFPFEKHLDWFLHPVFWAYMLSKNPRGLGIRSQLRTLRHTRRNLSDNTD